MSPSRRAVLSSVVTVLGRLGKLVRQKRLNEVIEDEVEPLLSR
jgi:hypothetical protein